MTPEMEEKVIRAQVDNMMSGLPVLLLFLAVLAVISGIVAVVYFRYRAKDEEEQRSHTVEREETTLLLEATRRSLELDMKAREAARDLEDAAVRAKDRSKTSTKMYEADWSEVDS